MHNRSRNPSRGNFHSRAECAEPRHKLGEGDLLPGSFSTAFGPRGEGRCKSLRREGRIFAALMKKKKGGAPSSYKISEKKNGPDGTLEFMRGGKKGKSRSSDADQKCSIFRRLGLRLHRGQGKGEVEKGDIPLSIRSEKGGGEVF